MMQVSFLRAPSGNNGRIDFSMEVIAR